MRARIRAGTLRKVAPGVYTDEAVGRFPEDRHRQAARGYALLSRLPLSHVSAAALHGLPLPGADLSHVHFSRPGSSGGRTCGPRRVHACPLDPAWATTVDGIAVTTVARSVIDVGRSEPLACAVAAADAALGRNACTGAELVAALGSVKGHTGVVRARAVLRWCDGRSESPGESLTRMALRPLSTGMHPQVEIFDGTGCFVARADGAGPTRGVLWEYDGEQKYSRLLRPGQDVTTVLLAERRREQRLVELGWAVVRVVRSDLQDESALRARFQAALALCARPGHTPPRGTWRRTPTVPLPL